MIHIKEKFIAQHVMFELVQAKTIVKVFFSVLLQFCSTLFKSLEAYTIG
jgi:hypothetical protein